MTMTQTDERKRVNHELKRLGFGGLDDPNLIASIAFFIRDHDHFRGQLFSVKPDQRRHAYNTLAPRLRFTPKPLDVYEAEMKQLAEQRQLPTMDAHGNLVPFKAGSVDLDLIATEAIRQNKHEKDGGLTLTCARCTTIETFRAKLRKEAEREAQAAGWRSDATKSWCPQHVPERCTMKLECTNCPVTQSIRCWDPQDGYVKARLRGWIIGDAATCPRCSLKKTIFQ